MKNAPLFAICLMVVFAMPMLCMSVCQMYGNDAIYTVLEISPKEGESDGKESEEKEEREFIEPYMVHKHSLTVMHDLSVDYFTESKELVRSKDVLTPPPEFV